MNIGQPTSASMNPMNTLPTVEPSGLEFAETQSVTLNWELSGLKEIFNNSRGDTKSKCVKSAVFGDPDNLWEVIFYPNSGTPNTSVTNPPPGQPNSGLGEYSSFYLSAVATDEEKAHSIKGKWQRKGLFAFRFEVKTKRPPPNVLTAKEAANHIFSSKTVNWGWQSFARRDTLYYLAPAVREADAFVITCTVSSNACPPAGAWLNLYSALPSNASPTANALPAQSERWTGSEGGWKGVAGGNGAVTGARKLVPKAVVDSFASLFDDETYSDVEFWLPSRSSRYRNAQNTSTLKNGVRQEDDNERTTTNTTTTTIAQIGPPLASTSPSASPLSEAEPQEQSTMTRPMQRTSAAETTSTHSNHPLTVPQRHFRKIWANKKILMRGEFFKDLLSGTFSEGNDPPSRSDTPASESDLYGWDDSDIEDEMRSDSEDWPTARIPSNKVTCNTGPPKTKIVIRDAAYASWQALIFYLYSDEIVFAPLASSFIAVEPEPNGDHPGVRTSERASHNRTTSLPDRGGSGRTEWIKAWMAEREGRDEWPENAPRPCSAKAIFRLADKLDLPSLRQRAFQHIVAQLTPQNIPYEVFSQFSATYEEVRKVEIAYLLKHWNEIKSSTAMRNIWIDLRQGRHQGFEEVWPCIVANLEYAPPKAAANTMELDGASD
ncbi:hypothetical protein NliqN6_4801 [Naganishia liquefaciens]|uniref:MATH domain-containing protein n=1 Tax=Naganishia liquefaciens TaxID=104408 RepID=A0A8H3TYA3_9TREE|nr:hypothetical protein NliqN6_4801 [Naganishia liquefaciens]